MLRTVLESSLTAAGAQGTSDKGGFNSFQNVFFFFLTWQLFFYQ